MARGGFLVTPRNRDPRAVGISGFFEDDGRGEVLRFHVVPVSVDHLDGFPPVTIHDLADRCAPLEEGGSGVMSQIMEAHPRHAGSATRCNERPGNRVRVVRARTVGLRREDERLRGDRRSRELCAVSTSLEVLREKPRRLRADRDPTTGFLYGITSNNSPNIARHLVTINPATALATDAGALGIGGADIAFDAAGNLYMTSGSAANLYGVNKASGVATVIGATGTGDSGSGLAINGGGTAFFAGNGDHGALATLNLTTGAATLGATLTGAPNNGGIDSMKFSSTGVLFGVDNNNSPVNNLVTIDTATGAVTNIGALPASIDGMAFAAGGIGTSAVPTLGEWALIAMALLLGGTGFVALRRRTA